MIFSFVHFNIAFTVISLGFLIFIFFHSTALLKNTDDKLMLIGQNGNGPNKISSSSLLKETSEELLTDLKLVHLWMSMQQKAKVDESWYINKQSKDLVVEILPEFPLTFHHRDVLMCGRSTIKLLILIFSDIGEYTERQTIRDTWAKLEMRSKHSLHELRWKRVFVVGYPLEKAGSDENFVREVMHNDLLGVNSVNTRTMQTLYGSLYWALNGCSFEKLLVVKSKMFVNIPAVYKLLHTSFLVFDKEKLYINTIASSVNNNTTKSGKKNPLKFFTTYDESGAWLASRGILMKLLSEIRIFMNSKFEGTDQIVNEFIQHLNVKSIQLKNFILKNGSCKYQENYFLSLEKTINCFPVIQREYEDSIKRKSVL